MTLVNKVMKVFMAKQAFEKENGKIKGIQHWIFEVMRSLPSSSSWRME